MPRPRLSGWRAPSAILAVVLAALLLVSTIALAQPRPVALVDDAPSPPAPAYTGPTSPSLAVELHAAVDAARASAAWYAAASTPPPPPSSPPAARARRDDSSTPAAPDSSTGITISSTAYCLTGGMADGQPARRGAVAANRWPLGTRLRVSDSPGVGQIVTVEDRIGSGSDLDFALPGDCAAARAWGRRTIVVDDVDD